MAAFVCDIVTPESKVVSEEVEMAVVPGIEGEMGFLAGHAPLVSVLADGVVRLKTSADDEARRYALQGGYVQVAGGKVIVLADRALAVENINVADVTSQLADVEARIAEVSIEEISKTTLTADKAWCEVQLKAAQAS